MISPDKAQRYDATARWLHWITVTLVIVLVITGKGGDGADEPGSQTFFWHSSLGVLVALVAATRILWAVARPGPALPLSMSKASRVVAHVTHMVLYALLFALPLSGWFATSAEGATVSVFGAVSLPRWELPLGQATVTSRQSVEHADSERAGGREESENSMSELHETLGNVLLIVAGLHILAALTHQFYWRDGLLERMLPKRTMAGDRPARRG